jgi:hypothetical protein
MENHLFIGLGGFGGRTLAEIRKYEHLNSEIVKARPGVNVNVQYIYCDSSMDICNEADRWKVLGQDVSLPDVDLINLKDGGAAIGFHDIDMHPHINDWLGNSESIEEYLLGAGNGPGANQRRRFGRYLFACNAERFSDKLNDKVDRAGQKNECTFHLFATLAGGTGSGSLVDAITIIRHKYPDADSHPIFVYGYATDREQDSKADVGFFYPNQYSVLRDLNALMVGKYQPLILTEKNVLTHVNANAKHVEAVYIITPENKKKIITPAEEQVKMVGNWVYQRVMAEVFGQIDADTRRAFTGEDILAEYLGEPGEETGEPERSCRFGSVGIKKWGIPDEETQEALMYNYLIQAFNQMLYNRWDAELGYVKSGGETFSSNSSILNSYGFGDNESWSLSKHEDFKSYEDDWSDAAEEIVFDDDLKGSISALAKELEQHAAQGFRRAGVSGYFQARHANEALAEVEKFENHLIKWMDDQWSEGRLGFETLDSTLQLLVEEVERLQSEFSEKSNVDVISLKSIQKKWMDHAENPGWLAKYFGIEDKMYNKYRKQMVNSYVEETKKNGYSYAAKISGKFLEKVRSLIAAMKKSETFMKRQLEFYEKERKPLLKYTEQEKDGNYVEFNKQVFDDIWKTMVKIKSSTDTMVTECRKNILRGESSRLVTLHASNVLNFNEPLEKIAQERVRPAHDEACKKNNNLFGKEILGRNIWEIFDQNNGPELKKKIKSFLHSGVTLAKRSEEKTLPGSPDLLRGNNIILNPMHTGETDNDYEAMFKEADVPLVFRNHDNPSEIICLSVDSATPARFFSVVHKLHDKYQEKIKTKEGQYFCHLDATAEKPGSLPSLLVSYESKN